MPLLSGLELLEEVKKKKSDVIVIMTTAYGSEEFAIKALQLGANNYLKKPINEDQLIRLLKKYEQVISHPKFDIRKIGKIVNKQFSIEFENKTCNVSNIVERLLLETDADFDDADRINIELGLLEMVTNAFEHGNLEITYDEKQDALNNNNFEELIVRRLNSSAFINRKITVDFNFNDSGCEWIIKDDGNGFNWKLVPEPLKDNLLELNGRGIFITKFLFDELEYSGNGNTVRVKKYL
jgi:CheY-like chemotaxis protein